MSASEHRFLTVRQFLENNTGAWPATEGALRALILDASWGRNQFQPAFKRVGRRVLIDPVAFWSCVEAEQEGRPNG